jgi:hypothetical protein
LTFGPRDPVGRAGKAVDMKSLRRRAFRRIVLGAGLAVSCLVAGAGPASAVEVGQPAPDFRLPSTTGLDVALSDFRGKSFVLVEFYGADFAPT